VLNYHKAHAAEPLGNLGGEGEWVLSLQPDVTDDQIEKLCGVAKNGCKVWGHPSRGGMPFLEMRGTEIDIQAVIESGHGAVKYVEPDQPMHAIDDLEAEDAEAGLWGLERISTQTRSSEGDGVTVFVLDTGVRTAHQEFGSRGIPTLDLTSGEVVECHGALDCAADRHGHGTHCAGSAAGTTYGVAPAATVRSLKILSDDGPGAWSWFVAAFDWMAVSSIRPAVASVSMGASTTNQIVQDTVDAATNAGVVVVAAAMNANIDACGWMPAFVPSAITVGSTDIRSKKSSFSNFGACVDIWAPGSSILSAGHKSDTDTARKSGTSMACPHVAGGAALLLQRNPSFNSAKVLDALLANARTDWIAGLYESDTNKELYVGSDGPLPRGNETTRNPPAPAPKCELDVRPRHTCGPPSYGVCQAGRCCSGAKYCGAIDKVACSGNYLYFSDNYGGVCDAGPTPAPPPTPAPTPAPPTPTPQPTPTPTPQTPTPQPTSTPQPTPAPLPTPPPAGSCVHETDCDVSAWCRDTRFEAWCLSQGQTGSCPAPHCRRT